MASNSLSTAAWHRSDATYTPTGQQGVTGMSRRLITDLPPKYLAAARLKALPPGISLCSYRQSKSESVSPTAMSVITINDEGIRRG